MLNFESGFKQEENMKTSEIRQGRKNNFTIMFSLFNYQFVIV